ncbi:hypothetical protein [Psychrobacter sp.]|uniref:hypothetical protein n=1 Tax=Psychrobacter sp. TaxID=56811 RepID=UPI0025EC2B56|nr:hypothetical protein [Psychrobacter sp.]
MTTQLYLNVLPTSITVTTSKVFSALASVEFVTEYAFDNNVVVKLQVTDDKSPTQPNDPLNNLIFDITFADKIDDSVITRLQGRLYTGGGADELEINYPNDFGYITEKLDFHGALNGDNDFFETIETTYNPAQATDIINALKAVNAYKNQGTYRKAEAVVNVPATSVVDSTPEQITRSLVDMRDRPRYLVVCEASNVPVIEAVAKVMSKLNCHVLLDIGKINDWASAAALAESINVKDHRLWLFWNPNVSRPANSSSVLARKKWRPCVGDYLGQLLIRNASTNSSGIPPVNRPIAGYDFPLSFRNMEALPGVSLDEEAQNALAAAGVNVVLNERFDAGDRWIYGDALTQYDSKTSALRLINAAEITTYVDNAVVSIAKKHLLKGMSSYVDDADAEIRRFLNATSSAGLLQPVAELAGKFYGLDITPRADNPFEKVDIKLIKRPEGCARQVYFETTITK